MDKKEQTVTEPMGMCEKLFHALQTNTAFRPLRRLTFGLQDQMDATTAAIIDKVNNPPPPLSFNYSLSSGKNNSLTPTKPHGTNNQLSSSKQVTTTLVDKLTPPKKATMVKVENKVKKESIEKDTVSPTTKVPPSAATPVAMIITPTKTAKIEPKDSKKLLPTPAPPKGSISPQPTPPPTTTVIMTTTENPKKNINEKVEDYIQSVKGKFRTGSGVGKAPSKNN